MEKEAIAKEAFLVATAKAKDKEEDPVKQEAVEAHRLAAEEEEQKRVVEEEAEAVQLATIKEKDECQQQEAGETAATTATRLLATKEGTVVLEVSLLVECCCSLAYTGDCCDMQGQKLGRHCGDL